MMNKIKKADLIYCIAFSLFIISRILSHMSYEIPISVKYGMTLTSTLIIVLKKEKSSGRCADNRTACAAAS